MEPLYSVLYYNMDLSEEIDYISKYLNEGIKVIWFGTEDEKKELSKIYQKFLDGFFLQAYVSDENDGRSDIIVDGVCDSDLLDIIEEKFPIFNMAQYRVEHCAFDANIVIRASAGTGKTTVMIDRIMFLLHTVPDLKMKEIYMITFTNEATNQMNLRLQKILLKKYHLTGNKRYLKWLEEQSQMHISTIDSFAYEMFKKYGVSEGFSRNVKIKNLEYERKELIKNRLDEILSDRKAITSQIGLTYHNAYRVVDYFWKQLVQKGFSYDEIIMADWGKANSEIAESFQTIVSDAINKFGKDYNQLKLDENAISLNDIFYDFRRILLDGFKGIDSLKMRYLFVDEFQDTDQAQIKVFCQIIERINTNLLVVGDQKQSIYRFRGATERAFKFLEEGINKPLVSFSLKNNYRTCENVMDSMNPYFSRWNDIGLLEYSEKVLPFNKNKGAIKMVQAAPMREQEEQIVQILNKSLNDLEKRVEDGQKLDEKTKVAVLVRSNRQLQELAKICRKNRIPIVIAMEKPFYLSDAVRDFYSMITSYVFPNEPLHLFNYLLTPYADFEGRIDVSNLEMCGGKRDDLICKLEKYLSIEHSKWHFYKKEFRLRPVLAVLKEMLETETVVTNYVAIKKYELEQSAWEEKRILASVYQSAIQYKADLNKLLEILQNRMDGEFATLYDIHEFLKNQIATNREEQAANIESVDDYRSIYAMTVHKSKGLEFDTVIIPFTSNSFDYLVPARDILMDNDGKVGWICSSNERQMENEYYQEMKSREVIEVYKEETRMLYVAMTRTIRNLTIIVSRNPKSLCWGNLLLEVGLQNE